MTETLQTALVVAVFPVLLGIIAIIISATNRQKINKMNLQTEITNQKYEEKDRDTIVKQITRLESELENLKKQTDEATKK